MLRVAQVEVDCRPASKAPVVPTPVNIDVNLGFFTAVFRPLRTVFPCLGAGFLNLAGKTEGTAKNGEKTGKNGREMA